MISLTFDFIAYTSCLVYVMNRAWSTLDWSKVSWMSVLILGFPMIHFLLEAVVRYWLYKVQFPQNYKTGFTYYNDSIIGIIVHIAGIGNYLLINMFLLRVFQVAAILKCESREEEIRTERNLKLLKLFYAPTYCLC